MGCGGGVAPESASIVPASWLIVSPTRELWWSGNQDRSREPGWNPGIHGGSRSRDRSNETG